MTEGAETTRGGLLRPLREPCPWCRRGDYKPGSMRGFPKTPKNEPIAIRMINTKKIM
jgi:hypothetical protein